MEYYNFKWPHQEIENVTPSERFYRVADQVRQIVAANTEKVAEGPIHAPEYRPPTYIVGNIGGRELRVVARTLCLPECLTEDHDDQHRGKSGGDWN